MQNAIITLLMAADVFIALIIIALVLVQQSKEGAFGSPFGGVGESVFGAHATSHLTKLTVIFSILFLVITLLLAILVGHRAQPKSIVERELAKTQKVSPAKESKEEVQQDTQAISQQKVEEVKKENNVVQEKTEQTKSAEEAKTLSPIVPEETKAPAAESEK